jgi:signal transduction histidine kinase
VATVGEERLSRLLEVGRTLVAELDLEVVLRRLLEVARELTGARYAAMGVLDAQKASLERFVTSGIERELHERIGDLPHGRGVLGLLIRDPRPLRLPDVGAHPESYGFPPAHPPMHSFLGVPVLIRGEAYGNLYLTEKEDAEEFTEEDENSIVVLADWAAIAIDNARLYQNAEQRRVELERAVRGLEVTTTIARAIGGETDLERVLELIAKRARALVGARWLCILVHEGDEFDVAATAGELADTARGRRLQLEGSVAGAILAEGRSERIPNAAARALAVPGLLGMDAQSALIVPLLFRGRSLGVLMAFDRLDEGPRFGREDEELMTSFAASAATAIHTARSVAEERLAHALEGAEQERGRWARELHDETLQALAFLRMMVSSALREPDVGKREERMRSVHKELGSAIDGLRNLITELRPAELDELGLGAALEDLGRRRTAATGLEVETEIDLAPGDDGPMRLEPQVESAIYRVAQEALANAAKHSGADRVELRLVSADGDVELVVADNGSGFDPEAPGAGFGLVGMRERLALVNGRLDVESRPGSGTVVRASVPASG